jgi:hypothetical protein
VVGRCWAGDPSLKSYFLDPAVSCTSADAVQVFATVDLTDRFGKAWPGPAGQDLESGLEQQVVDLAVRRCAERFKGITGKDAMSQADGEGMSVHEPISEAGWRSSGGRAVCTSRKVIVPQ